MAEFHTGRTGSGWAGVGIFRFVGALVVSGLAAVAEGAIDFNTQIRPLLSSRCYSCHGPDEESRKAGLRIDLAGEARREREGVWPIKPGRPDESEVVVRIVTKEAADVMPPPKAGGRLAEAEVELIRRWVAEGAPYAEHWAWRKPERPVVPAVRQAAWPRNEIDNFILAGQEARGLAPSVQADGHTLARRLSLDLTGLPPRVGQGDELMALSDEAAYERLVDQLLGSPHFGERWARVWLDLARYADSAGYGSDPLRPNLWPWRDWVIGALNRNLPYDQFTIDQLAGDLIPGAVVDQIVATGFNRNTMTNTEGGTDDEEYRVAAVKDRANTTAQVWMGLTLGCAQCHTHKYDPISQREYYQFYAFFNQTEDHDQPDERPTLPRPTPEEELRMEQLRARIAELEDRRARNSPELDRDLADWAEAQRRGVDWRILKPVEANSRAGVELTLFEDGSLLTRGGAGGDTYAVTVPMEFTNVTAFRFESQSAGVFAREGGAQVGGAPPVLAELRVVMRAARAEIPRARYVRIELPGPRRVLSLAEVEVLRAGVNYAMGGAASQSSTNGVASSDLAVDGKADGDYAVGSVSETLPEDAPWWEVDLGAEQAIEEIVVWNRTDNGLGTRMTDFKVVALGSNREEVWGKSVGAAPNPAVYLRLPAETELVLQNRSSRFGHRDHGVQELTEDTSGGMNGWDPGSTQGRTEVVAFEVQGNPVREIGARLTFLLTVKGGTGRDLGRFRLSATTEPHPVRELPEVLREILALPEGSRTSAQLNLLRDFVREFAPSLAEVDRELRRARQELDSVKPLALPIMRELGADRRRSTRIMHKGSFLDPGEEVEPGIPAAFHPWPDGAPRNRLGLAHWLVSRENPLTARVAVNRLWARLFGVGLVETEEDFGTQGSLPSHPELLDWLAVEFMDRGWDLKAMIRLMVTSATYRQSAVVTTGLLGDDPRNRWLARAPRLRLEAEMVRDQALALAGLISLKLGGPSVFPPQPDGLWRAAFNGERDYPTSTGEDRYRRGLYVFLRRTVPNPTLSIFDAPSRESCSFRRLPTNTPLQAFVTLNDPVYVEAAQGLARRIVRESGPGLRERVRYGLRLCLGRPPTAAQEEILARHFEEELAHYGRDEDSARKLAAEPHASPERGPGVAELAAWTSVANVLLNLDALLNRG
ncbi:MAG: DUF1553 domain-containing protein [Verrucomicrobia bacterium]|nr:DUF1553 domain-containing protein [Verrucomicrobiota bacterium]